MLSTKAGDLELRIPKFDRGSFFPGVLEPRRRIDQAMYAVVMEAYVNGVSTRSVGNLVAALGVDIGDSEDATFWTAFLRSLKRTVRGRGCCVPVDLRSRDLTEVLARWDEVADTLEAKFPKAAASMRTAKTDVLAFTAFPPRLTGARSGRTTRWNG